MRDLKDLVAWQKGMELVEHVYRRTKGFPADERFGLRLQLRRSSVSVPSNIAEGHGRATRPDYARFVRIARGSLKETETQILIAQRLGYFVDDDVTVLIDLTSEINRLLAGLHRRLTQ